MKAAVSMKRVAVFTTTRFMVTALYFIICFYRRRNQQTGRGFQPRPVCFFFRLQDTVFQSRDYHETGRESTGGANTAELRRTRSVVRGDRTIDSGSWVSLFCSLDYRPQYTWKECIYMHEVFEKINSLPLHESLTSQFRCSLYAVIILLHHPLTCRLDAFFSFDCVWNRYYFEKRDKKRVNYNEKKQKQK